MAAIVPKYLRGQTKVLPSSRIAISSRASFLSQKNKTQPASCPDPPAMAPKKNAAQPAPSAAATTQMDTTTAGSVPAAQPKPSSTLAKNTPANWDKVLQNIYQYYMNETPQRTKLIDVFLAFIAVVGALQFLYCILAGNYVRSRRAG